MRIDKQEFEKKTTGVLKITLKVSPIISLKTSNLQNNINVWRLKYVDT